MRDVERTALEPVREPPRPTPRARRHDERLLPAKPNRSSPDAAGWVSVVAEDQEFVVLRDLPLTFGVLLTGVGNLFRGQETKRESHLAAVGWPTKLRDLSLVRVPVTDIELEVLAGTLVNRQGADVLIEDPELLLLKPSTGGSIDVKTTHGSKTGACASTPAAIGPANRTAATTANVRMMFLIASLLRRLRPRGGTAGRRHKFDIGPVVEAEDAVWRVSPVFSRGLWRGRPDVEVLIRRLHSTPKG